LHKKILFLFFFIIVARSDSFSQWIINDYIADSITLKGINYIYNLEFENADRELQQIINLHPEHPAGYFFYAMVDWWKIQIDPDNEYYDSEFKRKLEKVIDVCDNILDKDEFSVVALFYKCGAIGFRGRLFSHRDSWLKAADDGRIAYPILMKAYRLAPTNYDIMLGMGIYDYFAEVIPSQYPILKPIMLFFPKGNKQRGIEELKMTAEKSRYACYESSYFLMQLYLNYENDPLKALDIAKTLYNKFPSNVLFHRYLGRCFVRLGRWVDVERTFSYVLERIKNKQRGYNKSVEREAIYYMGMYHMAMNNLDVVLQYFYRCDELCRDLDKKKNSGFMVMTNLKVGMIFDMQNKRNYAVMQYEKVLDMDSYETAQETAKNYLKNPYKK
jgi:hypothetical protein